MKIEFLIENKPEVIARLNKTVHQKHVASHPKVFETYHFRKFFEWYAKFLKKENTFAILVKKEGEYIGYALLIHKQGSKLNPFVKESFQALDIDQMSIESPYQHQGIGTKLLAFIREWAREKGIDRIRLDVWSDNVQARKFYLKNGFHTVREIMEYKVGL